MAPNTWTDVAEKDLIWTFIKVSNGGKMPKGDWKTIHREMTRMGYKFSSSALNQHWSKTVLKNYGNRDGGNSALTSAPSTPSTSRKRAAPGSGARVSGARRGDQAAHEMAAGATAVDDGQDDDEPELEDIKPNAKRAKISKNGAATGLKGQQIDLTNDDEDVQTPQRLKNLSMMDGIKVEGEDGYFGRGRERSMTAAPAGNSAEYFNAFANNAGPSQHRSLDDSI
ncbi:hypothetical protein LX32DRAFT_725975 [Colletotrichum zoysiae]|uniref:Uncharacterized protein n=1 Tax=Colletotrichum zoysiae TaxID=1216348 RepID=A0AAD9HQ08_9PEZI|nr:hypothetical protein LX32DRAFT_725975 [Colletotrichum zoysiae]